jgi:hypothetical protein
MVPSAGKHLGRAFTAAALLVGAVLILQAAMGIGRIGISNDEPLHVSRTNEWLRSGWYLPGTFFDDEGDIRAAVDRERRHTYGGTFSITEHVLATVVGVEPWDAASNDGAGYAARRVAMLVLGIAAALAVAYATLLVTRRRSVAAWTGAALLAMPLWTGYSLFAVKDVPAGAGWTMTTAGCIAVLAAAERRLHQWLAPALVFTGVWFGFGTRIALWLPVFGTILLALALGWVRTGALRQRMTMMIGVPAIAGAFAVALLHPQNARTPVTWLLDAALRSGDFEEQNRLTMTAGQLLGGKPPSWYLPAWVGASTPILLGVAALVGLLFLLRLVVVRPSMFVERLRSSNDVLVGLWAVQALVLPAAAIGARSTMYGGARHHLYVFPAVAALAGYGIHRLTEAKRSVRQHFAVGVIAVVAIVAPTVDQLSLHPYGFVYKNVLAGSLDDRWETDMHWVSAREALQHLPAGTTVRCYVGATVEGSKVPRIRDCTNRRQVSQYVGEIGKRGSKVEIGGDVWVIARRYNASPPHIGCSPAANVTRRLRGQRVTLSYVLRCDPAVADISPQRR